MGAGREKKVPMCYSASCNSVMFSGANWENKTGKKALFGGHWGGMKVILEEQPRGSPAPGISNHHLSQAHPLLTASVSLGLYYFYFPSRRNHILQHCLWKCTIYVSTRSATPLKSTWHSMSHSAFLTIGSYQNWMSLKISLLHQSMCAHYRMCRRTHMEVREQNSILHLTFYLEWVRITSLLSAVCVRPAGPWVSRDSPVPTSSTSTLPTRTPWLQTFVLSIWLLHRFSGCRLWCSCLHSKNFLSLEPSPQPMIRIVLGSALAPKYMFRNCHPSYKRKFLVCFMLKALCKQRCKKYVAAFF